MTVIACDKKTMSADRLMCANGTKKSTNKIYQINNLAIGFAGTMTKVSACLGWITQYGLNPEKFPETSEEDFVEFIIYNKEEKTLKYYENSPYAIEIFDDFIAIGSGTPYAETAMKMGKSPEEAVQISIDMCIYCGGSIDTVNLEG